nr:alpha/beta fold hydrolase [Myceligenerans sp. TRM 65318]
MSIQRGRPSEVADPVASWQLDQVYPSSLGDIRWARLGGARHRPVVLLHGTPFSSFIWRDVGRALAQQRQVYVWDMPGYGQSARSADQDLSLGALAGVFVELLRHWDIDGPDVIAHDSAAPSLSAP